MSVGQNKKTVCKVHNFGKIRRDYDYGFARIRQLFDHTAEYVRQQLPKIYSRELIDVVFDQPYCRIANVVESGIAKRQTASEYLKKLAKIGVLEERKVGRERLFLHPKLFNLVTQEGNNYQEYTELKDK